MAGIFEAPAVECTGTGFVVPRELVPHPASHQVRDFCRNADYLWRLCIGLAYRNSRVRLDPRNPNDPGMAAIREAVRVLAKAPDELFQYRSVEAVAAYIVNMLASEEMHRDEREGALPRETRGALLRLFIGILVAVYLMLRLVLAALTRHPDALTFVLVMLASCLRHGRHDEPDDPAFLPMCPYQRSLGRRPQS